ncbi:MAG: flagellar hook-basal body complex protein [Paracoccaceae bacterium]
MDNAGYVALTRQSGLMREMQTVANNIANASTTGYRKEGLIFAEHISAMEEEASLSMASADVRNISLAQAEITSTGGAFDFAIDGEGFFLIETPRGQELTRAGSFALSAEGELVTAEGFRLLDAGGAAIQVPPGSRAVTLAGDGTLAADGQPVAQIGTWLPADPNDLTRTGGTRFVAPGGVEPAEGATVMQGFLEGSNVDPVAEVARMIEVQRAYEMGQTFLEREDQRIRAVLQTLGR